ncbi:hypothetical protein DUNSADRAFT_6831 [Dunaliella salina]|uniref:Uncharacterized protein n=1 Tax=Dunaliella salina TaxID=3046 RepID=A0ABQ7GMK4_DUNSA|nr:hypothetical protein DUNSADRAFT_6831 [Dunaliella salina]|eukprot:KAF5835844.1 hypothetical protein DUNSADRAFT_6831 [Dunaliella salina]
MEDLRSRLAKLGVDVQQQQQQQYNETYGLSPASPRAYRAQQLRQGLEPTSNNQEMEDLLTRIHSVEMGLQRAGSPHANPPLADLLGHADAAREARSRSPSPKPLTRVSEDNPAPTGPSRSSGRHPVRKKFTAPRPLIPPAHRPHSAGAGGGSSRPGEMPSNVISKDLMRGATPHTPLAAVLQQYKEAEVAWAHDKAQLRKEAVEQRRRANKADAELQRVHRMSEHKAMDIKALKSALKHRDEHLADAEERLRESERILSRSTEEANAKIAAIAAERDDLRTLLVATLQRLEAVDEAVHRTDLSSAMMEEKMRALEEERLAALESAARARAEVAELTESRRKLEWQSRLLEKMSEVQLKHNKRKSEAIKKLLAAEAGGEAEGYAALRGDSDLGGCRDDDRYDCGPGNCCRCDC